MLTRVAQDAERALRAVEQAGGSLDDERVPRLHRGTRAERIVSVADPEMRHGRKSQSQRFDGFKLARVRVERAGRRCSYRARVRAARLPRAAPGPGAFARTDPQRGVGFDFDPGTKVLEVYLRRKLGED